MVLMVLVVMVVVMVVVVVCNLRRYNTFQQYLLVPSLGSAELSLGSKEDKNKGEGKKGNRDKGEENIQKIRRRKRKYLFYLQ